MAPSEARFMKTIEQIESIKTEFIEPEELRGLNLRTISLNWFNQVWLLTWRVFST